MSSVMTKVNYLTEIWRFQIEKKDKHLLFSQGQEIAYSLLKIFRFIVGFGD